MRRERACLAVLLFALPLYVATGRAGLAWSVRQRPPAQSTPTPQRGQPTFKVRVDLVSVDVSATDAQGRFVNDLTKDDFELLDDGKPQVVSTFDVINIPVSAPAANALRLAPPEVRTNAAGVTGRLYLIVLDDVHTSFERSGYVQQAAREFVEKYIEPGDIGGVAMMSGRRNVSQDFTADRRLLLAAIAKFSGMIPPSGTISGPAGPTPVASSRGAFDTLRVLAEYLGTIKGRRKACIYIGEGFQPPGARTAGQARSGGSYRASEQAQPNKQDYRDLATAANRANVNVYAVDPRGLSALAEGVSANNSAEDSLPATAVQDAVLSEQDGMAWLAAETGGFTVANTSTFGPRFERIQREASSYYLLGYYPPSERREGTTHQISVRVRRPGVTLRARREYSVPKSSAPAEKTVITGTNVPAQLLPLLDSPIAATAIRFSAAATPFKKAAGTDPWASIVLEFDGRDLDLEGHGALDLAVVAADRLGKVRGHDVRRLDLALDPSARQRVLDAGLRAQVRVDVPHDACTLRVAVADVSRPRTGSLWLDLAVPDFEGAAISTSGILLTDSRAGDVPTAHVDEEIRKSLPAAPTTRRDFSRNVAIAWLAEVYQKGTARRELDVTTTIATAGGHEVYKQVLVGAQAQPPPGSDTVRVANRVSLQDFAPGDYVLSIDAKLPGTSSTAHRELAFRITP